MALFKSGREDDQKVVNVGRQGQDHEGKSQIDEGLDHRIFTNGLRRFGNLI